MSAEQATLIGGAPVTPEHREIDPATGLQKAYVVLSAEERAKGFVRPVRRAYRHVGSSALNGLRDLTDDERERYQAFGYVKFQPYENDRGPVVGRYWTQHQLDAVGGGCGRVTTMHQELAETYAREPAFYSGTFCATCRMHFPVGLEGEFVWDGTDERVGT